jgi:hypothetical protein
MPGDLPGAPGVAHHDAHIGSIDMGGCDVNQSGSSLLAPIPYDSSRELINLGYGGLKCQVAGSDVLFFLFLLPCFPSLLY